MRTICNLQQSTPTLALRIRAFSIPPIEWMEMIEHGYMKTISGRASLLVNASEHAMLQCSERSAFQRRMIESDNYRDFRTSPDVGYTQPTRYAKASAFHKTTTPCS